MPFFKQKPFRIEAVQVTEENIAKVFAWAAQSAVVNTHSLTPTSFVLVYGDNPPEPVSIGSWVIKRTNDSFGVIPEERLHQRWDEVTIEEANQLPQINRQQKTLEEVSWTRFSELTF